MSEMLPILLGGLFWGFLTERSTHGIYGVHKQHRGNQLAFAMLVLSLALPIAMRTYYNDTYIYISNFVKGETLPELLAGGSLHLLRNPAFAVYSALVRTFTDNHGIFFLFPALFVQYSYMRFVRRHCQSLVLGVLLYFCLGTYVFSLGAMKQTIAMALLLYATDYLMEHNYKKFGLLVFLAFLFHTYALVFLLLPLFTNKPWTLRTFGLLGVIVLCMINFEDVIYSFLEILNEGGKSVSDTEIIGTAGINPLRVAVYAVVPLFALVFRRYLFYGRECREYSILVNMSILCVSIMSIGLVSAANMFARMGQYFEFGVICSLPWMLEKPFEKSSTRLVTLLAAGCFVVYFIYSNVFWAPFDPNFTRSTLMEYLSTIWMDIIYG